MYDKIVKPHTFHDFWLLADGVQQFDIGIFLKHHSWVGKKSKHGRFEVQGIGIFDQTFQYFSMANMNTIKCSDGNRSEMLFVVFGDALDRDHLK